jgi:hypothetical protein
MLAFDITSQYNTGDIRAVAHETALTGILDYRAQGWSDLERFAGGRVKAR